MRNAEKLSKEEFELLKEYVRKAVSDAPTYKYAEDSTILAIVLGKIQLYFTNE